MHGGSAPQVRKKAEERIRDAADPAAAKLVELMQNPEVPYPVQLAAARDLLDRAGIGRGQAIEIKIAKWEQDIGALIVDIEPDEDGEELIAEAELVEPEPELPPARNGRSRYPKGKRARWDM